MKKLFQRILAILARGVIEKYQPKIIGVTGTVGKTSTKNAIVTAISSENRRVRADAKSFNTEIGFPLAILGSDMPGRSITRWLGVFFHGLWLLFYKDKNFPEVLILEYGADKPGDISYLVSIARPNIAVLTAISPVHMEFFKTIECVKKEKAALIFGIKEGGTAILNADFDQILTLKEKIKTKTFTYSLLSKNADVYASEIIQKWGTGLLFHVHTNGSSMPLLVPGVAGQTSLYPVLAALCVGLALGENFIKMGERFALFVPQPGRMRYLRGIKRTILIDDSYNSSPLAAQKAIEFLSDYPLASDIAGYSPKKFAILGGMNELGAQTNAAHRELGELVAKKKLDRLVIVGEKAMIIARAAKQAGMKEEYIISFDTAAEAGKYLQDVIKEGDVLLFKGSERGIFLEEAVKEVLADPQHASSLLVRQNPAWQEIKTRLGVWVE